MSSQKYRMTVRCGCGNEFKKVTTNRKYMDLPEDSEELKTLMSKISCPKCKAVDNERRFRIGDGEVSDRDLVEQPAIISADKYSCFGCNKNSLFYKEKEGDMMSHCPRCGSQDVKYMGHKTGGIIAKSSQNMIKALDITAKMAMDQYKMGDINLNSNMKEGDSCAPKLPPRQQQAADAFFNGGGLPNASRIGANAMAGAYSDPNNPVASLHQSKKAPKFNLIDAPTANIKAGQKISQYDKMLNRPH